MKGRQLGEKAEKIAQCLVLGLLGNRGFASYPKGATRPDPSDGNEPYSDQLLAGITRVIKAVADQASFPFKGSCGWLVQIQRIFFQRTGAPGEAGSLVQAAWGQPARRWRRRRLDWIPCQERDQVSLLRVPTYANALAYAPNAPFSLVGFHQYWRCFPSLASRSCVISGQHA